MRGRFVFELRGTLGHEANVYGGRLWANGESCNWNSHTFLQVKIKYTYRGKLNPASNLPVKQVS